MGTMNNLYMARMATQERPCFICSKFTPVVLTTTAEDASDDWFYVCRTHLGDRNFCTKIGGPVLPSSSPPKSPKKAYTDRPPESDSVTELVASIGSAWSAWRNTKKKEEDKEKEEKEKEEEKKKKKKEEEEDEDEKKPSPPPQQQPIRFILHRDYFYLRQREVSNRIKKKEASEKLRTLQFPEVPKEPPKK
ncbi:VPS4-associated protein 1 [Dichotomocladium elegans]|nr:VPS4-associated protein 1 [Dichotomocladium elegans]